MLDGFTPKVVTIGEDGITESDILVHDETIENPAYAQMLANMKGPELPVPVGFSKDL